ncbi:hypothetical protein GCM10009755_02400 [Brevibacterium samyangense]|uniref:Uncharacterized protein n=1 Tax=Brevibacterium samyangense TaxID=366888 RepID=A0ABN2T4W6_9MICO
MRTGHDVGRDPLVVEREEDVVTGEEPAVAHAGREILRAAERLRVALKERVPGVPLPFDEGTADEEFAGEHGIDPTETDLPVVHEGDAVERDLLVGDRGTGFLRPPRFAVLPVDEVPGGLDDPLGFDGGDAPGPQPRGLDEFGGNNDIGLALEQSGTGEDHEPGAPGALVLASLRGPRPDHREQPGEEGPVDLLGPGGGVRIVLPPRGPVHVDLRVPEERTQLGHEVLPFPGTDEVDELGPAQPPELRTREFGAPVLKVVPQPEDREEIGGRVGEPAVHLVGLRTHLGGAFARVLDRESGDDDRDLSPDAAFGTGEDHTGQARVDRQPGELPADLREGQSSLPQFERTELHEKGATVPDRLRIRRGEEREVRDVLLRLNETEGGHLEDDARKVRPEDLRVRELRTREEVPFGVHTDADALARAARTALALVRARLRDPFDRQPLDLRPVRVPGDPGGPDVDDVLDTGDGEGGLGDVRREHDARAGVRGEDTLLFAGGETAEERDDLPLREPAAALLRVCRERLGGVPDLPLPGEEHENVAGRLGREFVERREDTLGLIGGTCLVGAVLARAVLVVVGLLVPGEGPVPHLDGEGPTGDGDDRGAAEVLGEGLRVDRRRGDDDLELGTFRQESGEEAHEEVDVEAAFVRLVDDDDLVVAQQRVVLEFGEEDAVRHHLDPGVLLDLRGETHLIADALPELLAEFLREATGDRAGGDPARLGVADHPGDTEAEFEADLRDLGRLARTGLTGDDDDLVLPDRLRDLVTVLADRQLRRVRDVEGDTGAGRPAAFEARRVLLGLLPRGIAHGAAPGVPTCAGPPGTGATAWGVLGASAVCAFVRHDCSRVPGRTPVRSVTSTPRQAAATRSVHRSGTSLVAHPPDDERQKVPTVSELPT